MSKHESHGWCRDLTDSRQRMLAETEAFLNWAWDRDWPRIPRRLVSEGGFSALMRLPGAGARATATHWWRRALERMTYDR